MLRIQRSCTGLFSDLCSFCSPALAQRSTLVAALLIHEDATEQTSASACAGSYLPVACKHLDCKIERRPEEKEVPGETRRKERGPGSSDDDLWTY